MFAILLEYLGKIACNLNQEVTGIEYFIFFIFKCHVVENSVDTIQPNCLELSFIRLTIKKCYSGRYCVEYGDLRLMRTNMFINKKNLKLIRF
jgi:hypothetical protein